MGRTTKQLEFYNNAGGINESISPFQLGDDECTYAQNVYFEKYGKYGRVTKRKGYTTVNGTAVDGKIISQYQFTIEGTNYMAIFTDNGTLYSVNMSTGACTSRKTGLSTVFRPTFAVVNNKCYANFSADDTLISDMEATTGWTGTGTGTGTLSADGSFKYKKQYSLKIPVANSGAGLNGAYYTPGTALNLTNKILDVNLGLAAIIATTNRARSANVATLTTGSAHGLAANDYVIISGVGGTGYNTDNKAIKVVTVPSTTTFTYANVGADETTTADTSGLVQYQNKFPGTVSKYRITLFTNANYTYWEGKADKDGTDLIALPSFNTLRLPVDLATKTGDGGTPATLTNITKVQIEVYTTAAAKFSMYLDYLHYFRNDGGIYSTTDNTTWTLNTNPYSPRPKYLVQFDGKLFWADDDTLGWSNLGAGYDFYPYSSTVDRDGNGVVDVDKGASSTPVAAGDGDVITGLGVIGKQLVIFKKHGIHRLSITGSSTVPYRIDPQLSGESGKGIGCASHFTVQNCVLENLYSDVYGKAEYLVFVSDKGIHALGVTGNPLDIQARVQKTYDNIPVEGLGNAFSVIDPRNQLYILFYQSVSGLTTSSQQLVFSLKAKAWSSYTMRNMTSATQYTSTLPFVVLGDSSGYLYKHNFTQNTSKNDFADGIYPIDAHFQSKYQKFPFKLELETLTIKEQKYLFKNSNTKIGIIGDDGVVLSETLSDINNIYTNEDSYLVATDSVYDSWVITFGESNTYVAYVAPGDVSGYKVVVKRKFGGIWNTYATQTTTTKKFAITEASGRIYLAVDGVIYKANDGSGTFSKLTNSVGADITYYQLTTSSERHRGFVFINWNGFPILCTSSSDTYYVDVLSNASYDATTNWVKTNLVTYQRSAGDNYVDVVWYNNNTNIYVANTKTTASTLDVYKITPNSTITSPVTATHAAYADSSGPGVFDFGTGTYDAKLSSASFLTSGTTVYFLFHATGTSQAYSFLLVNGSFTSEVDPDVLNGLTLNQGGRLCKLFTDGSNILALTDFYTRPTSAIPTIYSPIHRYTGLSGMPILSQDSGFVLDDAFNFSSTISSNYSYDMGTINGVPFIVNREKIGTDYQNASYTTQPKNIIFASFAGSGFQKATPGYVEEAIHARVDTQSFSFFIQNNVINEAFSLVGYYLDYYPTTNRKGP